MSSGSSSNKHPAHEKIRQRIRAAKVARDLILFFKDELDRELTAAQVNVGLRLLNKVAPDIRQLDVKATVGGTVHVAEVKRTLIEKPVIEGQLVDESS